MFDGAHYPMRVGKTAADTLQPSCISENAQIIRFRESGSKDKFARLGAENERDASTRIFKRFLCGSSFRVNSARLSEKTLRALHSLQRFPAHRRRRRMVEVYTSLSEHSHSEECT